MSKNPWLTATTSPKPPSMDSTTLPQLPKQCAVQKLFHNVGPRIPLLTSWLQSEHSLAIFNDNQQQALHEFLRNHPRLLNTKLHFSNAEAKKITNLLVTF